MAAGSEYGIGRRSAARPTNGCNNDAVSWNANVIRPISPKSSPYDDFSTGYTAGTSDWIISLSRWQKLSDSRIAKVVVSAAGRAVAMAFSLKGRSRSRLAYRTIKPLQAAPTTAGWR